MRTQIGLRYYGLTRLKGGVVDEPSRASYPRLAAVDFSLPMPNDKGNTAGIIN